MIDIIKITDVHGALEITHSCNNNFTAWMTILDYDDYNLMKGIKDNAAKRGMHFFHRHFRDVEDGPFVMQGPHPEDVDYIIDCFRRLKSQETNHIVGVNCYAGVSRSTATGMIGYMVQGFQPEVALGKIVAVRKCAWPNELILKHYDDITGSNSLEVVQDYKEEKRKKLFTGE